MFDITKYEITEEGFRSIFQKNSKYIPKSSNLFQNIFDKLQDVLPTSWNKVIFYAMYSEGSYSMKYYVDRGDNKYIDCFNQPDIKKSDLIRLFVNIDKVISVERNALVGPNKWSVITLIVDSQGQMKAKFDYKDISENLIEYEREWRKKYLKS